jgi:ADP-heptose:LPS heptosyltransferase
MNFSKAINQIRRTITQKLTKKIGNSNIKYSFDDTNKPYIKNILIIRPNKRLGNLLLITPLIQDVVATFPDCKIDLLVKGKVAPTLFKNYENILQIIQVPNKPFKELMQYLKCVKTIKNKRYDLVINVDKNSSSGRLATKYSNSKFKFFGDYDEEIQAKYIDYEHIAKYPIYSYRNNAKKLGYDVTNKPIPSLNLKISQLEIDEGKEILHKLVGNDKKTICLFTYATGDKCLSEIWWETFYEKLKIQYPNYTIIEILPVDNISRIAFKAPSFYSKSVREIGSFIANTSLFIGADSGIMHLACASRTPVLGLFSVSNLNKYQPYNNSSFGINTTEKSIDDCLDTVNKILEKEKISSD